MRAIRLAPFALRVVERKGGKAAIVYRRRSDKNGQDRLQRVSALSTLAFAAGTPLIRDAISKSAVRCSAVPANGNGNGNGNGFRTGKFYPLDADWGARAACFSLLSAGLRDGERMLRAANHVRNSDPNEAAWWLGLLTQDDNVRPLRAFRILTEAVE